MENSEIIKQVLDEMLLKTKERKIKWTSINANAFRWVKTEGINSTIVTLQKQPSVNSTIAENYILSIQGPQKNTITQINTATEKSLREILSKLFIEANFESARIEAERQAEIIKNLLKGL